MNVRMNRRSGKMIFFGLMAAGLLWNAPACHGAVKVFPRLITPGDTVENGRALFETDYAGEPRPSLGIFDLRGRKVREVSTMNPRAVACGWQFAWDGRDDNGDIVLPGVYVYQWAEGETVTKGAIVVAR